MYIGESKNLAKRLKQHGRASTSTFYKNYVKLVKANADVPQELPIADFRVRTILTRIGRKELEEFGIVNLPANLNKFQLGKRSKGQSDIEEGLWESVQAESQHFLEEGELQLERAEQTKWFEAIMPPRPGLYWVESKKLGLIYIGESSNLLDRWKTHSAHTYFSALRRHIGENILRFELQTRKKKKRYFSEHEDAHVTDFLKGVSVRFLPIQFGRYELEEHLIKGHNPLLNRKGNKPDRTTQEAI